MKPVIRLTDFEQESAHFDLLMPFKVKNLLIVSSLYDMYNLREDGQLVDMARAGMRAAFEHMLSQFSPRILEERFEGGSKRGGIMSIANKVRYWEMYREMFEKLSRDSDDNFRELFGEEFATAYEEQMQKIIKKM